MRKITIAVATALVLGAITIAIPKLRSNVQAKPVANPVASPAAPHPVNANCNQVKFRFQNDLAADKATIRIEKVSYHLEDIGDKTELVHTDNDCKYNSICITTGDTLTNAAGRKVTNIQLHYKYLSTIRPNANWSDLVHTPNQPNVASPDCKDYKTYGDGADLLHIPAKQ